VFITDYAVTDFRYSTTVCRFFAYWFSCNFITLAFLVSAGNNRLQEAYVFGFSSGRPCVVCPSVNTYSARRDISPLLGYFDETWHK